MKNSDIIRAIIKELKDSTHTSWKEGNLEQWADYARNMSSAIRHAITVLDTLDNCEDTNPQITELININKELVREIKKANISFPPFSENTVEFDTPLDSSSKKKNGKR